MGNIPNTTTNGLVLTSVGNGSNDSQWAVSSGGGSGITQLTGDVTAGPGSGSVAATVAKINGTTLGTLTSATNGQVLTWNTSTSTWIPSAGLPTGTSTGQMIWWNGTAWIVTSTTGLTTNYVMTWNGTAWVPAAGGNTLGGYAVNVSALNPTTDTGAMLTFNYNSFTGLSQWVETYVPTGTGSMFFWNGTNWESTSTTGIATGNVLVWNNSTSKWVPGNLTLAGDVTGSSGANTVVKLQNYPVNVTGLSGSGGFMYYTSTGSQFVFSGSPTGAGSIMYWNGSGYVSTAPSSTGVLQWNSGSSTYSYVSVGGSTPNNDVWSSSPQTLSVSVSASSTTVNTVAFNTSATFTKFLITFNAAQTTNSSVADILYCDIRDGSSTGTLVAAYAVGTSTTSSRNIFSSSVNYVQATAASSTLYLKFYWKTAGTTGSLNYSMITVLGVS